MAYMLTSDEKQIAEEWKKYEGYTVRPVPSTIQYYQSYIANHISLQHALIYGGTPEIRSIFQRLDRSVILMDRSFKMMRAMGSLTFSGVGIADNETYLEADWLAMDKLHHGFDLLIGDDAINMVTWDQFEIFLRYAHSLLKRGGVFICHLLVKPDEEFIKQSVEEIYHEYEKKMIRTQYDLASRLNFICFDYQNYRMGWQQTIKKIGETKLALFKPAFDFISTFGLCNSYFHCPPQHYFEVLLKSYFSIEEIFYPHEHEYCQFEPVYILKK